MKAITKKLQKAHRSVHGRTLRHQRDFIKKRLSNFAAHRFVFRWISLSLLALIVIGVGFYSTFFGAGVGVSKNGGNLYLGVVDDNTKLNLNPFYLNSPAEVAVGKMIYSSALQYDELGKLAPDLAQSWTYSDGGKTLELKIGQNLKWQDGVDITVDDFKFTYEMVQNPDVKNINLDALRGLAFERKDDGTLVIKSEQSAINLADVLTQIPIAPKHLLAGYSPDVLRSGKFNQKPVGSGKFYVAEFRGADAVPGADGLGAEILLNKNQYAYGVSPSLDGIVIRVYKDDKSLALAEADEKVLMGVGHSSYPGLESQGIVVDGGIFLFFNTGRDQLSSPALRRTLAKAVTPEKLGLDFVKIDGPVPGIKPAKPLEDVDKAAILSSLDAAGWKMDGTSGLLKNKDGASLTINLYTGVSSVYGQISNRVADIWRNLGVTINVNALENKDLNENYIGPKSYDALIYGISLSPISDPYAYWASTTAAPNTLNLSNYANKKADIELDIARTKLDAAKRSERLQKFVDIWFADMPAVPLYQTSLNVEYSKDIDTTALGDIKLLQESGDIYKYLGGVKVKSSDAAETP